MKFFNSYLYCVLVINQKKKKNYLSRIKIKYECIKKDVLQMFNCMFFLTKLLLLRLIFTYYKLSFLQLILSDNKDKRIDIILSVISELIKLMVQEQEEQNGKVKNILIINENESTLQKIEQRLKLETQKQNNHDFLINVHYSFSKQNISLCQQLSFKEYFQTNPKFVQEKLTQLLRHCIFCQIKELYITKIPIQNCQFLRFLDMPMLIRLYLSGNFIEFKSFAKSNLPYLQILNIEGIPIKSIPFQRFKFPKYTQSVIFDQFRIETKIFQDLSKSVKLEPQFYDRFRISSQHRIQQKKLREKLRQRFVRTVETNNGLKLSRISLL